MLLLCSLSRCHPWRDAVEMSSTQSCHCCAAERKRAELLPLQWVCCSGLKHDIPPSASPQVYQHTSQRIYTQYTRFLRDRRVTFRDVVKCIRFISNKRRSLANFTLICHVAVHLYKRPQHALAQHTGQRRRKTWILSLLGLSSPYNPAFLFISLRRQHLASTCFSESS